MKINSANNRKIIVANWILGVLFLVGLGGFLAHRFALAAELKRLVDDPITEILIQFQEQSYRVENVSRWHDSSLIFLAVSDFQLANGHLPKDSNDFLLDPEDNTLGLAHYSGHFYGRDETQYPYNIVVQNYGISGNFNAVTLPGENNIHIWPEFVCVKDPQDGYQDLKDDLSYAGIIDRSQNSSDFAVVYRAEKQDGNPTYIKCLDSIGGPDTPDFIFK